MVSQRVLPVIEPGVDQAGDLKGGEGGGDVSKSVGLGRIGQAEAVLAQDGSLEGEVPGVCW